MTSDSGLREHKRALEALYANPRHPGARDRWVAYTAETPDEVAWSEYRYADPIRRKTEEQLFRLALDGAQRVLEVGCGTGYFCRRAIEIAAPERPFVTGVDLAARAVRLAHDQGGAGYILSAGECLPLPDRTFDCVISVSALEYVLDPAAVIREMYRVLRPGGRLLLVLHRLACDPTVIPTVLRVGRHAWRFAFGHRVWERKYSFTLGLRGVRRRVFTQLRRLRFERVAHAALMSHCDIRFWRAFGVPMRILLRAAALLNRSPVGYWKDLEGYVLRRPVA